MFRTDMGSQAFQEVYDLINIDKALLWSSDLKAKDMPVAPRKTYPEVIDSLMNTREQINDLITRWLAAVIIQERGMHDVNKIDSHFHHILSERGILEDAKEIASHTIKINTLMVS